MSREGGANALDDRKVLPRWRAPSESIDELVAVHVPESTRARSGWIEKLTLEFESSPSAATGRELIESAFVLGKQLAPNIRQKIGEAGGAATSFSRKQNVTSSTTSAALVLQAKIRETRSILKNEPSQPLAWTELARHHLSKGNTDKATKAMQCALSLAPENRYVLRSATRFFELIGDPEQALHALKRSGRLPIDPWLLSADIALNGDQRSNSLKIGMRMLSGEIGSPRSLTELAAAVGTVEHNNGRHKSAKKMIAQSLLDPNENSIAQAIYISQQDNKIKLSDEILNRPLTYEARARRHFADAAWKESMQQSLRWLRDEPFDSRPALLGSALSFDRRLTQEAYDIATEGLSCVPNNALLLNNRAVAGAYLGKMRQALTDIVQALKFNPDRPYLLATFGLVAYRCNMIDVGARAYGQAIALLIKQKDSEAVIRAYLFWLREAVRVGQLNGIEEMAVARRVVEKLPNRDVANEMNGLVGAVVEEKEIIAKEGVISFLNHEVDNSEIIELEAKIIVPPDAAKLFPMIENNNPGVDLANRLASDLLRQK